MELIADFFRTTKCERPNHLLEATSQSEFCFSPIYFFPGLRTKSAKRARPIFASSLRDVFSFVLRCFRFFELVHEVFRGLCLLITNRITPAWINNADQLSRGERLLVTSLFTFVLISIRLDS